MPARWIRGTLPRPIFSTSLLRLTGTLPGCHLKSWGASLLPSAVFCLFQATKTLRPHSVVKTAKIRKTTQAPGLFMSGNPSWWVKKAYIRARHPRKAIVVIALLRMMSRRVMSRSFIRFARMASMFRAAGIVQHHAGSKGEHVRGLSLSR